MNVKELLNETKFVSSHKSDNEINMGWWSSPSIRSPGLRNHRRRQTKSGKGWMQSSCRRSTWGTCTSGGMTIGHGRVGDAQESGTEPGSSHSQGQPEDLPGRWFRFLYVPLKKEINNSHWHFHRNLIHIPSVCMVYVCMYLNL